MKPPSFEYAAPTSVAEAVKLLQQYDGDGKILAGGQSLMPLLNMRLARPAILVDVARIDGFDAIRDDNGAVTIGAMARQRSAEFSDLIRTKHPLLREAILNIAHPQNRNQGTIGGSLAHADPAAELPATALALDAEFRAAGPNGERQIAAKDFFVTYLTTCLEPTEILTEIRFPALPPKSGWSFIELARRHGDFALAGVIAWMTLDGAGRCANPHIVLFGVGSTPIRAAGAEQMIAGQKPEENLFAQAGAKASTDLEEPLTDVHATSDYRRDLARVLTRRALLEAAQRAAAA